MRCNAAGSPSVEWLEDRTRLQRKCQFVCGEPACSICVCFEFLWPKPLISTDSSELQSFSKRSCGAARPALVTKDAEYSTFNYHASKVTYRLQESVRSYGDLTRKSLLENGPEQIGRTVLESIQAAKQNQVHERRAWKHVFFAFESTENTVEYAFGSIFPLCSSLQPQFTQRKTCG